MSSKYQKQVIYLVESPLTERDFNRFGILNWINHGWNVEVFDLTSLNAPEFWEHIKKDNSIFNFEGLRIFHNINELLFEISNLKNKVIFIDLLNFRNINIKVRKAARANGIIVNLRLGNIPKGQTEIKFIELFKVLINPFFFFKKMNAFVKNKLYQTRAKKFNPDYLVVGGTKSMSGVDYRKTSIIKAHNFDYDYFIEKENKKSKKNNHGSLVFLDEDAAFHLDYMRLKIKPFVTPDNYYPIINNGLNKIAKLLNLKIKIAAHPRSNYETKPIKFKFPIEKNNTFDLIRDAEVVMGHSSTALQYAILLKKPIILVTTDEIQKAYYAKHWKQLIHSLAITLGKKVINLDHISDQNNFQDCLKVDHKKYELYVENFIKSKGSSEKKLWDIVIEHMEKDFH